MGQMQPKGDPQAEEELDGTKKRRSHLIEGGGGGGKVLSWELCLQGVYEEK